MMTNMKKIKVFLFEDDWMCIEAIRSIFSQYNDFELIGESIDADKGIRSVFELQPDIILMDIRLDGELDGILATRKILKKLPDVKIVIFTSYPDEQSLQDSILAGVSGYLLKDEVNNPKIIIQAIRSIYNGNAYLTPSVIKNIFNIVKKNSQLSIYDLTKRELEILALMGQGKSNNLISKELFISKYTVKNHVANIFSKMEVKNRTEAVLLAQKGGIFNT